MLFHLDTDRLLVHFTVGNADLAIAFAELEGYRVKRIARGKDKGKIHPIPFHDLRVIRNIEMSEAEPRQISPGVYAYSIVKERYAVCGARRVKDESSLVHAAGCSVKSSRGGS